MFLVKRDEDRVQKCFYACGSNVRAFDIWSGVDMNTWTQTGEMYRIVKGLIISSTGSVQPAGKIL